MTKKLTEQIVEILADGPLTLKEITTVVIDSGYKPPNPPASVVAMVSQALFWLTQNGHVQRSKNETGRLNQYSVSK